MTALDFARGPSYEVVIVGDPNADDTKAIVKTLREAFIPNKVVMLRPTGAETAEITRLAQFTKDLSSSNGKATAYVCRGFRCELPTTQADKMLALLNGQA
jgi:uncharacterized protein YyaL (SSP411 family)